MRTFTFGSKPPLEAIPVVREFLAHQVGTGGRNVALRNACHQLRDNYYNEAETREVVFRKSHEVDGLSKSEIENTIKSAFTRPPREAAYSGSGSGKPLETSYSKVVHLPTSGGVPIKEVAPPTYALTEDPLPEGLPDPTRTFLKALFRAGQNIIIVRAKNGPDGRETVTDNSNEHWTFPLEYWLGKLDEVDGQVTKTVLGGKHGLYVGINPLKGKRRLKTEVADHRYVLIEFDDLPKNHQWQLIVQSQIPCVAVVDSGGRSIHAIVDVGAADDNEYEQRRKILYDHFKLYDVDENNKDCSRLSRLPGAIRGDMFEGNEQKLLAINIGKKSFVEWHKGTIYDDLPLVQTVDELMAFDREADPNALIGLNRWITKGSCATIIGPSGIGKSSLVMQFAISLALGKDFFGIKSARPLKVMLIQAENDMGDMAEALQGIVKGMGLTEEEIDQLEDQLIIVPESIHTGTAFINLMSQMIQRDRPDVVISDPLMAYCSDLMQQGGVSEFLRHQVGPLLKSTKVAWFWVHHTGKPKDPNMAASMGLKEVAYMGYGSSELTNWSREIIVLQHVEDDTYSMSLCKRGPRAGMTDHHGEPATVIHIKHATGRICWEQVDDSFDPEEAKARRAAAAKVHPAKHDKCETTFTMGGEIKGWAKKLPPEKLKQIRVMFLGENVTRKVAAERLRTIFTRVKPGKIHNYLESLIEDGVLAIKGLKDGLLKDELIGLPDDPSEAPEPTLFPTTHNPF